jgi:hypothetical protein
MKRDRSSRVAQKFEQLQPADRTAMEAILDLLVVSENTCPHTVNDDLVRLIRYGNRRRMSAPEILSLLRQRIESYVRDQI